MMGLYCPSFVSWAIIDLRREPVKGHSGEDQPRENNRVVQNGFPLYLNEPSVSQSAVQLGRKQ